LNENRFQTKINSLCRKNIYICIKVELFPFVLEVFLGSGLSIGAQTNCLLTEDYDQTLSFTWHPSWSTRKSDNDIADGIFKSSMCGNPIFWKKV